MSRTLALIAVGCLAASALAGVAFVTKAAPADGAFRTGLASDGAKLYYYRGDDYELYVSGDGGDTWLALPSAASQIGGGPGWNCWSGLAYWPGGGTAGHLVVPRENGGVTDLAHYDIATQTWSWQGVNPDHLTHGTAVIGSYLYGVWHAGGDPVVRIDLTSAGGDAITQLTGLSGHDPNWFSRAANVAAVNGLVYGIKNDWQHRPPGTGDRLYRYDPAGFVPAGQTPATDLGLLPSIPGYGSTVVALPPSWSSEIGPQGGLFIVFGRYANADWSWEGWGDPSSLYALYDIGTGNFALRSLPGTTGSGTSATFQQGLVFIKRGGAPDDPYNSDLWVASGNTAYPCLTTRTLTVLTSPVGNLEIAVAPPDCAGQANGVTPFTRQIGTGEYVQLTAPPVPRYRIQEWQVNGSYVTDQSTVVVHVPAATTAEAIYKLRCDDLPVPFTVTSAGTPTGVEITYSPADCDSLVAQVTPFVTNVGLGERVTFIAPCVPDYNFVKWTVDGNDVTTSHALTLVIDFTVAGAEAVYEAAPPPYLIGSLSIETLGAPIDSEFASALASDGTNLYYLRRNSAELFRTTDACLWTELKKVTDDLGSWHGDWHSGMLAWYAGLGAQGSLFSTHRYPDPDPYGNAQQRLVRYDIASDTWSFLPTATVMGNAATIVGGRIYGVWHAGGANFGGPIARADLNSPPPIDERTFLDVTMIGGYQPDWFSRVVQFAVLGGQIYAIKNDWTTPQPPPSEAGDRLLRFDPDDWFASQFFGGNPWNTANWAANPTPVTDLGPLPFEPGYGAAMVALPPNWCSEVGPQGGLFIVAGRSPANHEGWGNASRLFAVYDVAGGVFTLVGDLPAVTGSGASATFHAGKVYIKRGGNPDAPYNNDLWVVSSTTSPCAGQVLADANCDGVINVFDIDPFVVALTNLPLWQATYPSCDWQCVIDINGDGAVNAFDIDPFVRCLTGGPCP